MKLTKSIKNHFFIFAILSAISFPNIVQASGDEADNVHPVSSPRVFVCTFPGCTAFYNHKSNLYRHNRRKHSVPKASSEVALGTGSSQSSFRTQEVAEEDMFASEFRNSDSSSPSPLEMSEASGSTHELVPHASEPRLLSSGKEERQLSASASHQGLSLSSASPSGGISNVESSLPNLSQPEIAFSAIEAEQIRARLEKSQTACKKRLREITLMRSSIDQYPQECEDEITALQAENAKRLRAFRQQLEEKSNARLKAQLEVDQAESKETLEAIKTELREKFDGEYSRLQKECESEGIPECEKAKKEFEVRKNSELSALDAELAALTQRVKEIEEAVLKSSSDHQQIADELGAYEAFLQSFGKVCQLSANEKTVKELSRAINQLASPLQHLR